MLQNLLRKRDFYAGSGTVLLGSAVTLNSTTYDVGSFAHMGPGMFPLLIGIILTFVGILIFSSSFAASSADDERILPETMEWRGWLCILAGPALFIALGLQLGMVAATFGCVFVSAFGDRSATLRSSFILAACVTLVGCLIFSYALKIPFPLFRWGH